ncbi:DUF4886 domain-containing protein [Ureibacillus yapensis]|uniref:DUF4886 domain-containing protein n=1 Tax=Ureibacillus yapensis TaxID=2304605 RepID=UPI0013149173|nr:DUF4886 domain-containing protein [Lysinibacillus yapensis]
MYRILLLSLVFICVFFKPAYAENSEPIKILSIGNSFSQDIQTYIDEIAASAGVDVIVGNLYRSGESLEGHWKQASQSNKAYHYEKKVIFNGESQARTLHNISLKDGLADENWDYITLQQTSGKSGLYRTYQPYLGNLIDYIGLHQKNPNAQLAIHMTWAYAKDSSHKSFPYYGKNQWNMYRSIVSTSLQAMKEPSISVILPTGTAIQNARTHATLNRFGDELTADGYHLGPLGDYIGGMVLFETFLAKPYHKDIFKEVNFKPAEITDKQAYLAKLAAKEAVKNPFDVTNIDLVK